MSAKYPYHLLAATGDSNEVTEWEHLYEDMYRCLCCGRHRHVLDLRIVRKGGRL